MYGEPQQEPSVAVILVKAHADALAVIGGDVPVAALPCVGGQGVDHPQPRGAVILLGDLEAQFARLDRLLQIGEQLLKGRALHLELRHLDDDAGAQISAVVEEVVLAHRDVTGGLGGDGAVHALGVELQRLVDQVAVAAHIAVVMTSHVLLDEACHAGGGDRVGHDGSALLALCRENRRQGDQAVAVDLVAAAVHSAAAVNVGVKDYAQIGVILQNSRTDGAHRVLVLGIWHVVGKHPVGIEIDGAGRIGSQRLQHSAGVKAAGAVARVHNDMKALERVVIIFGVDAALDDIAQVRAVARHIVRLLHRALVRISGRFVRLRVLQQGDDVAVVKAAVAGKELQPVAVEGVVRSGDLYRRVTAEVHRGHEHRGGGHHPAVVYLHARLEEGVDHYAGDALAGDAAVAADRHRHLVALLAHLLLCPEEKARSHARDLFVGQVDFFAGHAFAAHAADVGTALQNLIFFIQHKLPPMGWFFPSLFYQIMRNKARGFS